MRGNHTITRKFHPVRLQKKHLRTGRGRNKRVSAGDRNDSVSIALRDLGDIDAKELNTIPNSISEEQASWKEGLYTKSDQGVACSTPTLHVDSAAFCPGCTIDLVKIHEIFSDSVSCNNVAKTRSSSDHDEVFYSNYIGENIATRNEKKGFQFTMSEKNDAVRGNEQAGMNQFSRGVPPDDKITCCISELSLQAYLCSTESTVSAVVTEAVQTTPSTGLRSSTSDKKSKLQLLCGELLLQLCKTSAENAAMREAADMTTTSVENSADVNLKFPTTSSLDQEQSDQISVIAPQYPEWFQKITRDRSRTSQHDVDQKRDYTFQGNSEQEGRNVVNRKEVVNSTPSEHFKPLLCTKLSVPWKRKELLPPYLIPLNPKPMRDVTNQTTIYTTSNIATKSASSQIGVDNTNLSTPEPLPDKIIIQSDKFKNLKPKEDLAKMKEKQIEKAAVCLECENEKRSVRLSKTNHSKGKKEGSHRRSSKWNAKLPKEKNANRHILSNLGKDKESPSRLQKDNMFSSNVHKGDLPSSNVHKGGLSSSNVCKADLPRSNVPKGDVPNSNVRKGDIPPASDMLKDDEANSNNPKGTASTSVARKGNTSKTNARNTNLSMASVATKYYIRSFLSDVSSASMPKNKSKKRKSRKPSNKPKSRRKKSTFTLPHPVVAQPSIKKKKNIREGHIHMPGKTVSKDDFKVMVGKELRTMSKNVKTHRKKHMNETNEPMFHTCFKHMITRELKNRGVHVKNPIISQKENSHRKKPKVGIRRVFTFPHKLEKRLNDKLFSCFIPRVFK